MLVFAHWDQFEHAKALQKLLNVDENRGDLHDLLPDARAFFRKIGPIKERLDQLVQSLGAPSKLIIVDLLSNAHRRMAEGRFDDAVARFYRAVEGMAQLQLWEKHRIPSRSIPPGLLPNGFRRNLGLTDLYRLLKYHDALNTLAKAFFESLAPAEQGVDLREARNRSVLAHGFQPVGIASALNISRFAWKLAEHVDIRSRDQLDFPAFR